MLVRRVIRRPIDYTHLTEIDRTVADLVSGRITRSEARDQIARTVSTGHDRPRWVVRLGWGAMGVGVALTLGGNAVICLLAFLAAVRHRPDTTTPAPAPHPNLYQQAAGGFVATLIAVAASASGLELNTSRVVTAGIVMLLAGVGIMGATQDALNGFPVTASARMIDAVMNTAGIIVGVGAGLTGEDLLGVGASTFEPGAAGFAEVGATVFGAALAAAGFAFASYAPLRALVAVALVGALGQGCSSPSTAPRSAGPGVGRCSCHHRSRLLSGRRPLPRPASGRRGASDRAPLAGPRHLLRARPPCRRTGRCAPACLRSRDRPRASRRRDLGAVPRAPAEAGGPPIETRLAGPRMVGPFPRPGEKGPLTERTPASRERGSPAWRYLQRPPPRARCSCGPRSECVDSAG
jgi:uncharacterized membrane protein YjjP (DUF1212 family)